MLKPEDNPANTAFLFPTSMGAYNEKVPSKTVTQLFKNYVNSEKSDMNKNEKVCAKNL